MNSNEIKEAVFDGMIKMIKEETSLEEMKEELIRSYGLSEKQIDLIVNDYMKMENSFQLLAKLAEGTKAMMTVDEMADFISELPANTVCVSMSNGIPPEYDNNSPINGTWDIMKLERNGKEYLAFEIANDYEGEIYDLSELSVKEAIMNYIELNEAILEQDKYLLYTIPKNYITESEIEENFKYNEADFEELSEEDAFVRFMKYVGRGETPESSYEFVLDLEDAFNALEYEEDDVPF